LYTASVLRHIPEEPLQPVPLGAVYLADDADVAVALRMDGYITGESSTGIPVGVYRAGGMRSPIFLDADFLVGPEAAHLNISGVSGLATKTSAIEWLLQSIFAHFPAHRGTVAAVCFKVTRGTSAQRGGELLLGLCLLQVALGVANVLAQMPVELAIGHAATAHALVATTTVVLTRLLVARTTAAPHSGRGRARAMRDRGKVPVRERVGSLVTGAGRRRDRGQPTDGDERELKVIPPRKGAACTSGHDPSFIGVSLLGASARGHPSPHFASGESREERPGEPCALRRAQSPSQPRRARRSASADFASALPFALRMSCLRSTASRSAICTTRM
jgi:hypothetical protein